MYFSACIFLFFIIYFCVLYYFYVLCFFIIIRDFNSVIILIEITEPWDTVIKKPKLFNSVRVKWAFFSGGLS